MCHLILFLPVIGLPVFWLWPLSIALPVYLVILLLSAWVYYYVIAAMRRKVVAGPEALIGSQGKVVAQAETGVWVRVRGELWSATSAEALKPGDTVEVVGMEELTLSVRRPRRTEIGAAAHATEDKTMQPLKTLGKMLPLVLLGLVLGSPGSRAEQTEAHKTVGDVEVYIGVIPAEVIQGRSLPEEKQMHGGVPAAGNRYHLVAALFDPHTGARITDAKVTATVAEPGLAGTKKRLEPMMISDTVTYGNYFPMSHRAVNTISLDIRVPGKPAVQASFNYWLGGIGGK